MSAACLLALALVGLSTPAEAYSAKGITGVGNAATLWVDTIRGVSYVVAVGIVILGAIRARGGHGAEAIFEIISALLVAAVMFYAEEILAAIKPGIAQAATGVPYTVADYVEAWSMLAKQGFAVGGLTAWIRRVRQ